MGIFSEYIMWGGFQCGGIKQDCLAILDEVELEYEIPNDTEYIYIVFLHNKSSNDSWISRRTPFFISRYTYVILENKICVC